MNCGSKEQFCLEFIWEFLQRPVCYGFFTNFWCFFLPRYEHVLPSPCWNEKSFLTLCFWETPKRVCLQTVKTHVKCSIMLHFIRVYTVKVKQISRQKKTIIFENYNLTPFDMYNGLSQVYWNNQKEESISIQRVNGVYCISLYHLSSKGFNLILNLLLQITSDFLTCYWKLWLFALSQKMT